MSDEDYISPEGNKISFDLKVNGYIPPIGNTISFNLTNDGDEPTPPGDTQYVYPDTFIASLYGDAKIIHQYRNINVVGFNSLVIGVPRLNNTRQFISVAGFNALNLGRPTLKNKNETIKPNGYFAFLSGRPTVYNLKQIVNLNNRGFNAQAFGVTRLFGGVKTINLNNRGFNAQAFGVLQAINTKADQTIKMQGVAPIALPQPKVSPQILWPSGIRADRYGIALVQFPPHPIGFYSARYGTPWVSHSPRQIELNGLDALIFGFARIYDAKQRVYFSGLNPVDAGVFGDIKIINVNQIVSVFGFDASLYGRWSEVYSNKRSITTRLFDASAYGQTTILNKSPAIRPGGIDSLIFSDNHIGYRIRSVRVAGFNALSLGKPNLFKYPQLDAVGFNALTIGDFKVSNYQQFITTKGSDFAEFGQTTIWHYKRKLETQGKAFTEYGLEARVEHDVRTIGTIGRLHAVYGQAWVSHYKRILDVEGIEEPGISINHRVSRHQEILLQGFDASRFGTRIIPEIQTLYGMGFDASQFAWPRVELKIRHVEPRGFATTHDGAARFGLSEIWNSRQYITQYYDGDSGLVPPVVAYRLDVANRDRYIGAIGNQFTKYGYTRIELKARAILAQGLDAFNPGRAMVADRIRYLKPDAIEATYNLSGWHVVFNDARVLSVKGFNHLDFGRAALENTRRYYNRVGNFDSSALGRPFVSFGVRTLSFDPRLTIHPPVIELPYVGLYTRYIDEVGRNNDFMALGVPELMTRINRLIPRWSHRDYFGEPVIKNVTPEHRFYGHDSNEFGQTEVKLQRNYLQMHGPETIIWGRLSIADKTRTIKMQGIYSLRFPNHKITKGAQPPYTLQWVSFEGPIIDNVRQDGGGIAPPRGQVSNPTVYERRIKLEGFNASRFGETHLQSNGIVLDYGIYTEEHGTPTVILKNREINLSDKGIGSQLEIGKPRLSPHTIYAVMEAPPQARQNHPSSNLHYVNSDFGSRPPGEVFGRALIEHKHRTYRNYTIGNASRYGTPDIKLAKFYIFLDGLRSFRSGYFEVSGNTDKHVRMQSLADHSLYGRPNIAHAPQLHRTIKPASFNSNVFGNAWPSLLNREVYVNGLSSMAMGNRRAGDTPFMWQGLRVGELITGNYGGFENSQYGEPWVSLKIREVKLTGFDSFLSEYDYTQFAKRMRVVGTATAGAPIQVVQPIGFVSTLCGVPNGKPMVHYIRPDGNADNFRKGAW